MCIQRTLQSPQKEFNTNSTWILQLWKHNLGQTSEDTNLKLHPVRPKETNQTAVLDQTIKETKGRLYHIATIVDRKRLKELSQYGWDNVFSSVFESDDLNFHELLRFSFVFLKLSWIRLQWQFFLTFALQWITFCLAKLFSLKD